MEKGFLMAIRNLRSDAPDSTENIRVLLENALKEKYGPNKKLVLDLEDIPASSGTTGNTTSSNADDDLFLEKLKSSLLCVVCKKLTINVNNNLIECKHCTNLYHQKCHVPTISKEDAEWSAVWYCSTCREISSPLRKKPRKSMPGDTLLSNEELLECLLESPKLSKKTRS